MNVIWNFLERYEKPGLMAIGIFIMILFTSSNSFEIQKYSFVKEWGSKGSEIGEFNYPHSIATDSAGNVYVTDKNNNRVQKFSQDGTFITMWGSKGSADGKFLYPEGIDLDSFGFVYVADTHNIRHV
jgi:DNA-binding beta-propeller fold protein YncE